jgi:hypothetical protein
MNALVFGGMSPRHHEWVRQVAEALRSHFDEVRLLDYRHWAQQDTEMDLEYEITQAAALAEGLEEYVVVAKSIGTVLTTLAVARGLLTPQYCAFMGFPLKVVEADLPEVAEALPHLPSTTFLHNDRDPLGPAEAIEKYIGAHKPASYQFMTVRGDTHDYTDFDLITLLAIRDLGERLQDPYYQPY